MVTNQSIMGSLHETAKHFGGWQTRHSEACRKTKRLFHSKTDILTFQGPTALFAIKQGVFLYHVTVSLQRAHYKVYSRG